ncbi:hypothetical protein [uncultured Flavobacterium sp.]|uniref:hypothetical protein n=1 Tax=uncultured Flavobacterium sp. TaxID=165435 RepID=UPI002593FB2C|nr:hypothetical protein [uncultured Flavobacterium sp.]
MNTNTKYNTDICFNRHRDNKQSNQAHLSLVPYKPRIRDKILTLISMQADRGVTGLELSQSLNKPFNTFSGRLSELKKEGLVVERGAREGSAILFLK